MRIRDLMSTPVITVSPETTLEEAAAAMLESKVGSAVVVDPADPGRPVGIVTETDFDLRGECIAGVGFSWFKLPFLMGSAVWTEQRFEEVYEQARHLPVEQVMSSPCVTVGEDADPIEAARLMLRHDIRHLPVLGAHGIVGIVSELDFLRLLAGRPSAKGASDSASS